MPRTGNVVADVDRAIGRRLRELRSTRGFSQQQFSWLMGVSYQQAHKYEKGVNRMSGGRLWVAAQALGVDVGELFSGIDGPAVAGMPPEHQAVIQAAQDMARLTPHLQKIVARFIRALGNNAEPDHDDE